MAQSRATSPDPTPTAEAGTAAVPAAPGVPDAPDVAEQRASLGKQRAVVDGDLLTSRSPDDLPAFCAKLVEEFCEGKHDVQAENA